MSELFDGFAILINQPYINTHEHVSRPRHLVSMTTDPGNLLARLLSITPLAELILRGVPDLG